MNKITKIFDNIGFLCSVENNLFIPKSNIQGYTNLDNTSIGYYIPYLVRNVKEGYKWETGVGEIQYLGSAIVVKRHEISSSSNNNKAEKFTGNNNEFYLFVNNTNFNTAFNNVILKTDHFTIDTINSIYLVDTSSFNIDAVLPEPNNARNIVIDIKPLSTNHIVVLREHNGKILHQISDSIRMVCDGQSWYSLNETDNVNPKALSVSDDVNFSIQSVPGGNAYSFQFNDGSNNFEGSELYWGSGDSNKLLFGSSSEELAHTVIPTSGSFNTVFNQDYQASDFIVYGSGEPYRNLFFAYDGRVGINIPSGSRPQTIFHVVNYSCSEILRLENRTTCQPAKFTLYHKPSSNLSNGDICSVINLAGKDSNGYQTDYANIRSFAYDTTNRYGGLVLSVSSGNSQHNIISGDLSNINLGYNNNNKLNLSQNGTLSVSGSNIDILASTSTRIGTTDTNISINNTNKTITTKFTTLTLGSGTINSQGSFSVTNLYPDNLYLGSLADGSLLTIAEDQVVAVSGISVSGNNINFGSVGSNKIVTTTADGFLSGSFDINDYFLTEQDISWNKFNARSASVCLKQIIFDEDVPVEEFAIGDQIEIVTDTANIYRTIVDVVIDNNFITELLLDQNVTTNTVNAITVVSITKGGFLLIQKSATDTISDSTSNVISIRPQTDTVFNTAQKDIDFVVYGQDTRPALKVHSTAGTVTRVSGIFYDYATKDNAIKPIVVNAVGDGVTNNFSTANFNTIADNNLFSGILSSVGTNGRSSYYGTYDQNGNVAEWLESETTNGLLTSEYVAGGSFKTPVTGSLAEDDYKYLKNIRQISINDASEDVGFRVGSIINLTDVTNISNTLNLSFVNVINPENIADDGDLYLQLNTNNFEAINIPNLGVVDDSYRVGKYEVTNTQYATFLNSLATGVDDPITSGLYNDNMGSSIYGGIIRSSNGTTYDYTIKSNMGNKPVNYVSYINSLRFSNWLHNGAPFNVDPDDYNSIINDGAYTILLAGSNYYVTTNNNKKYFLPSLDQWHKSAYFEFKESVVVSGSPVVTMGTDEPYVVATEALAEGSTEAPKQVIANLTVSGWLVVDKIYVKDGAAQSSLKDIGFTPLLSTDGITQQSTDITTQTVGGEPPPTNEESGGSSSDSIWNNSTSSRYGGGAGVYGEAEPPLPPDGTGDEDVNDCTDPELIATNNVPFWCSEQGRLIGPYFY